jgi:hypothetical protein
MGMKKGILKRGLTQMDSFLSKEMPQISQISRNL